MTTQSQGSTEELKRLLQSYSANDEEFWSFKDQAIREHAHIYFQYPAMMVPRMQGQLMSAMQVIEPGIKNVFDPFVGSGTTMTEAMMHGLDFTGYDINPLAILICRAKIGPFKILKIQDVLSAIVEAVKHDHNTQIEVDFQGRDKWFQPNVANELSKIRRAIQSIGEMWCRRFFWVVFAETIRLTSNSRTSTFKLHIRTDEDIKKREQEICPTNIFEEVANRNLRNLDKQKKVLEELNFLNGDYYRGEVKVILKNSMKFDDSIELHDLLITSPPYGDNGTTVPYGQHSYLPLQWIDLQDIDDDMGHDWLKTTHEIDSRSLGGSLINAIENIGNLSILSDSFRQVMKELEKEPRDRKARIAAFYRDLNMSLDPIIAALKPNAYMIWTVGARCVAGRPIPIDPILRELLAARGVNFVTMLSRKIPTKRMASRNKLTPTIHSETILVMRKGNT